MPQLAPSITLLLFFIGHLVFSQNLFALGKLSHGFEFDPYYSDVFVDIPFKEGASDTDVEKAELRTYRDMLEKAFIPRFLTLEASVNPLPITGVLIREDAKSFYRNAQMSPSLNAVEAVTAGFEEPYAISAFLGKVIDFEPGKTTVRRRRKGYVGFLANAGAEHIARSKMVSDKWVEVEWKVKGDLETEAKRMSWSFRAGTKVHSNPEISDLYYVGLRRSRIDYQKTKLSFFLSSAIEYRMEFSRGNFEPLTHYLMLDKNFPIPKRRFAFSLGLGYLWRSEKKYTGSLSLAGQQSRSQILIRPNIRF